MINTPKINVLKISRFTAIIIFLCLFFTGALTPAVLVAQSQKTGEKADTLPDNKQPGPIPIANIATETENTLTLIREIQEKVKPTAVEIKVDSLIPEALNDVALLRKNINLDSLSDISLRESEKLKGEAIQFRLQLNNYRDVLIAKSEEINKLKEKIDELQQAWEVTLSSSTEEEMPEEIKSRVENNLKEIDSATMALDKRNKYLLVTQDNLTEGILFLDEILNKLASSKASMINQLYTIDSPPLWAVFSATKDTITFTKKIGLAVKNNKKELYFFLENYKLNIYVHLFFFIASLTFFLYIKRVINNWPEEKKGEETKISLFIITRPISSSLLLSLLFTGIIYSMMPSSVMDYFHLLLIIPVIFLIPGIFPGVPKKYFYGIALYFVISQLSDYFHEVAGLYRFLMFVADAITLTILVLMVKNIKALEKINPDVKWPLVLPVVKISIFTVSVGILANIFGNVTLSRIMSNGAQAMYYGGLIIYSAVLVARGFFALLMQQEKVSKLNMVVNNSDKISQRVNSIIYLIAFLLWIKLTLENFLLFDPLVEWIGNVLSNEWEIGSVSLSLGNILAFVVTIWISVLLAQFIRFLLEDEILTHFDLPRGVPGAIAMITRLIIIIFGFVLAFGAAKIDMSNVSIIIGALGVGIGFGLQNIFNNLVSGLILAFERPIQSGDVVEISNLSLMGTVKEIGIRASIVRTFDGAEVVVPNGNLISNEVVNWTLSDQRRRQEILIGVAYGTDLTRVLEILNKVVPEQENVLKVPKPFIIFEGFGDSSLDFRVLFWTSFHTGMSTKSAVGIAIDEAFKKEGIRIPFPQRDLHLVSLPEDIDAEAMKPVAPSRKTTVRRTVKKASDKKTAKASGEGKIPETKPQERAQTRKSRPATKPGTAGGKSAGKTPKK